MKIKRTKNLLYIFSSVMVLGLALISFDVPKPADKEVNAPGPNQSPDYSVTPSQEPTRAPNHTATPSPVPTATPSPTPSPTPTPSLGQLNAAIPIRPATDEIGNGITTVVTNYLNNYYSNEELQVNSISNITCYYKEGIADVDYFAYVSYDISYEGSNVPIPTFEEYLICIEGESATVLTESSHPDVKDALFHSRASESVAELSMKELVRRYMNAQLAVDEPLLTSMITDPSYLNFEDIRRKTEYIEEYKNYQYLFYKTPQEIQDFDYLVFFAHDNKIVNISTMAPGCIELLIQFDEDNYPKIFFGVTSKAADDYLASIRKQEEYQIFYNTKVEEPLVNAMLSDPYLLEFIERIVEATKPVE